VWNYLLDISVFAHVSVDYNLAFVVPHEFV